MGLGGGRHEEGEVWVFSVPSQRCSEVYGHVLIQREQVWHFEFCLFLTQESLSWHSAIHRCVCDCDR